MHGYNVMLATNTPPNTIIFTDEGTYMDWNWAKLQCEHREAQRILDKAAQERRVAVLRPTAVNERQQSA